MNFCKPEWQSDCDKAESAGHIDPATLDLMPGGRDGLIFAGEIRSRHDVPIVMITGKNGMIDRAVGPEPGEDDYTAGLRKKTEANPGNPRLLKTVRGMGYIFACEARLIRISAGAVQRPDRECWPAPAFQAP